MEGLLHAGQSAPSAGARDVPALEDSYPISPLQQGLLMHSREASDEDPYIEQWACTFPEALVPGAMSQAWEETLARHQILRTSFTWDRSGAPRQEVHRTVQLPWQEHDLRGEPRERLAALEAELRARDWTRFDQTHAPLLRLTLLRLAQDEYTLLFTYHHALLDGTARTLVVKDALGRYEELSAPSGTGDASNGATIGAAARTSDPVAPPPPSFKDYIDWLEARDESGDEAFWRETLAGYEGIELPELHAPTDGSGEQNVDHGQGREVEGGGGASSAGEVQEEWRSCLPRSLAEAARAFAAEHGLTLNALLQGAWALLLARYSGADDVAFGVTRACRRSVPRGEAIVGPLMNTLPVRMQIPGESSVVAWLQDLRAQHVGVREHEHSPLAKIGAWSELAPGTPLFETLYDFKPFRDADIFRGLGEAWLGRELGSSARSHYPLAIRLETDEQIHLKLLYQPARFAPEAIERLGRHYATLLEQLVADPERPLCELSPLDEPERQELAEWGTADTDCEREATIPELFAAQVESRPDAVAVCFGAERLTYGELDARSGRLADRLVALGAGPDMPIGVCLERSIELVVALVGIVKAGAAYLPLDPEHPDRRLALMLADAGAPLLLCDAAGAGRLEGLSGARVVSLDAEEAHVEQAHEPALGAEPRSGALDADTPAAETPAAESRDIPLCAAGPESLAYVVYTSGSTGRPKGVGVPHRAVLRLVRHTNYVEIGPEDVVGLASNASFDALTFELWGALLNGARLEIVGSEERLSPGALTERIEAAGISVLLLTTAIFNAVARERPAAFAPLRYLLFGGEVVDPHSVARVLAEGPPQHLLHIYGPTESTTFATFHPVLARDTRPGAATIPIGRPVSGTELYVLDRHRQPVPAGAAGELYIGGEGLARGYLSDPELTAERFIAHPFFEQGGSRLYRSGDRVRWTPEGRLEFLGRIDQQVKIRGFRVEPGEIEACLCAHPGVEQAAVVAHEELRGERRLVAYLVPARAEAPAVAELRAHVRHTLPEQMVPSAFVVLDALPLTPNGKVDRRALPTPDEGERIPDPQRRASRGPLEARLAEIWADVLGLDQVGVNDDFFDLGGHSLLATQVVSRVGEAFGVELPLRRLFEAPTVAGLALEVTLRQAEETSPEQVAALLTELDRQ